MDDTADSSRLCYRFGCFRLDVCEQQLYKDGRPIELPPRLVRTLELLVGNHGRTLEKAYLMEQLWPNTVVEENSLTVTISMLRKVLGDDSEHKKYILTKPGRGYRFVAEVTETTSDEPDRTVVQPPDAVSVSPTGRSVQSVRRYASLPLISLVTGLLLLLAGLGAYEWTKRNAAQSLAVLPFRLLGAERDDDYLGLGIADGLIARLRNAQQVSVRPTAAVAKYQSAARDPLALGKELRVASLLDGTVERRGDQLWLRVKLLRVKDGALLWSDVYHGAFADILTVQDHIAERVAQALALKLDSAEHQSIRRHYTSSSDAYQQYLAGRYYCGGAATTERFLELGISYFQQSTVKDPQFALAYASLAACYVQLAHETERPSVAEILSKAELAAQRALEIDGNLQEAYLPLAMARAYGDWDYPGAESAFRRSIELAPEGSEGHADYAEFLSSQGRFQEAEREAHEAAELDPFSWDANTVINDVYFYGRHYREAVEGLEKGREVNLDTVGWYLAWIYASQGRSMPIIQDLLKAQATASRKAIFTAELAYAYALGGMNSLAENYMQNVLQYPESIDDYEIGLLYVALGDRERAFHFLAQAREQHSWNIPYLKVDPRLDSLRSDPRFEELLRSVHLSP
jgi:DNA-binding winged helix-turn-helix (wHTH) protein/TolB-like protein